MKKQIYLTIILCLTAYLAGAQTSNAILFTENGERFQVILNGILQNETPETNVKLTGLNAPNYKARIMFQDTKLGYVDFNMFFGEPNHEVTWNIKQNNKGKYVTRMVSAVPLAQAPPPAPAQKVVVYTETPAVTTTTVEQTHTTSTTGDNVNFNMGVSVGEENANISINTSGPGMNTHQEGVVTTTTTTTHSVTTTTGTGHTGLTPPPPAPQVVYVTGYNGPVGCPVPMSPADFSSMKETISSKSFENTKLTIAKQVLNNNCLTSAQVKEVMMLFDFENTKLDYAKYAYDFTYDTGNYYKVNDAFDFESSIEDLNRHIGGR